MRVWIEEDELYPWHIVLTENGPDYVEQFDVPDAVVEAYLQAKGDFMRARKALMAALKEDE